MGTVINIDGGTAHPGLKVVHRQWDILCVVLHIQDDTVTQPTTLTLLALLNTQISPFCVGLGTP